MIEAITDKMTKNTLILLTNLAIGLSLLNLVIEFALQDQLINFQYFQWFRVSFSILSSVLAKLVTFIEKDQAQSV